MAEMKTHGQELAIPVSLPRSKRLELPTRKETRKVQQGVQFLFVL